MTDFLIFTQIITKPAPSGLLFYDGTGTHIISVIKCTDSCTFSYDERDSISKNVVFPHAIAAEMTC